MKIKPPSLPKYCETLKRWKVSYHNGQRRTVRTFTTAKAATTWAAEWSATTKAGDDDATAARAILKAAGIDMSLAELALAAATGGTIGGRMEQKPATTSRTLRDAISGYHDERRGKLRGVTLRDWRTTLNAFEAADNQDKAALSSSLHLIQLDQLERLAGLGRLSPGQYLKRMRHIQAGLNHAVRRGWIERNAFTGFTRPAEVETKKHPITAGQLADFIEAVPTSRGKALVAIMALAGLRPAEAERLTWQDVTGGGIYVSPTTSKTGGGRLVPTVPSLKALISEAAALAGLAEDFDPRQRIATADALEGIRKARKTVFPTWQPDALRHSYASHFLAAGGSMGDLQKHMGHGSSRHILNRYAKPVYRNGFLISETDAKAFFSLPLATLPYSSETLAFMK